AHRSPKDTSCNRWHSVLLAATCPTRRSCLAQDEINSRVALLFRFHVQISADESKNLKYQIRASKSGREKQRNLRADKPPRADYDKSAVSASEIIKELPKLSELERQA